MARARPPCHDRHVMYVSAWIRFCVTQEPGETKTRHTCLIVVVEVGGGLVQRHDAAVDAEGLGQREADDDGGQHTVIV